MKHKEKVKIKEHKEEKTAMYFKIDSPLSLRKEILRTAIDTTQLLRDYESFKSIKHTKMERYKEFNKVLKDIELLTKKLRSRDLPVINKVQGDIKKAKLLEQKNVLDQEQAQKLKAKIKSNIEFQKKEPVQEAKVEQHLTDEERLEKEIRDIQSRLNRLDV
jgi:hypothetical protein